MLPAAAPSVVAWPVSAQLEAVAVQPTAAQLVAVQTAEAGIPRAVASMDAGFPLPWHCEPGGGFLAGVSREGSVRGQQLPSDVQAPFVQDGLGAPKGLTQMEHVLWATKLDYPLAGVGESIDEELLGTLEFDAECSVKEIDEFRSQMIANWVAQAEELKEEL